MERIKRKNDQSCIKCIISEFVQEDISDLLLAMFHTAHEGLSYSIITKMLHLVNWETDVLQLTRTLLLQYKPVPFITYSKQLNTFILVEHIKEDHFYIKSKESSSKKICINDFFESWDGLIMAAEQSGNSIQKATKLSDKQIPLNIDIVEIFMTPASPINVQERTDKAAQNKLLLGKISSHYFMHENIICFEKLIKTKGEGFYLDFYALSSISKKSYCFRRYYVPVTIPHDNSIFRFYLRKKQIKSGHQFDFLGVRGIEEAIIQL